MENSTANGTAAVIQSPSLTPKIIFQIVVFCVIFLLGISANGLVIYVTGVKMKTTLNSVWFLNLALADFFHIFSVVFTIIGLSLNLTWHFGDFMCKFVFLLRRICIQTSISLLTVMSMDRCLIVWAVVWARNKRTPNKARLICVIVWLVSLVCNIPFSIYRNVVNNRCIKSADAFTEKWLATFYFVIWFLIPFLIITCCYMTISIRANQIKREKMIRPFLIILAIILSFFVFWLPIHVIRLIISGQVYIYSMDASLFNSDLYTIAKRLYLVTYILSLLHSCLNPFLYMFMCKDFKQKLKQSVFMVLEHTFAE